MNPKFIFRSIKDLYNHALCMIILLVQVSCNALWSLAITYLTSCCWWFLGSWSQFCLFSVLQFLVRYRISSLNPKEPQIYYVHIYKELLQLGSFQHHSSSTMQCSLITYTHISFNFWEADAIAKWLFSFLQFLVRYNISSLNPKEPQIYQVHIHKELLQLCSLWHYTSGTM